MTTSEAKQLALWSLMAVAFFTGIMALILAVRSRPVPVINVPVPQIPAPVLQMPAPPVIVEPSEGDKVLVELAIDQFQREFNKLVGDEPTARRFPPQVRERLNEIVKMMHDGLLDINVSSAQPTDHRGITTLASVRLSGTKREITIHAPRFLHLLLNFPRNGVGNVLAVMLVHESIHLENWQKITVRTEDEFENEEIRTWAKTALVAIRPMFKAGLVMAKEDVELDQMLQSCDDKPECPAFRQLIISENTDDLPPKSK